MKKIYAEPMTKVMKLNVASIMNPDLPPTSGTETPDKPTAQPLDLF